MNTLLEQVDTFMSTTSEIFENMFAGITKGSLETGLEALDEAEKLFVSIAACKQAS